MTADDVVLPEPFGHVHSDGAFCQDRNLPHEWWPVRVYAEGQVRAAVLADRERRQGAETCPDCGGRGRFYKTIGDRRQEFRCDVCAGSGLVAAPTAERAGEREADFQRGILAAHTLIMMRAANTDLKQWAETLEQLADDLLDLTLAAAATWKTGHQMYREGVAHGKAAAQEQPARELSEADVPRQGYVWINDDE